MKLDLKGVLIALLFLLLCITNIISCEKEIQNSESVLPNTLLDSLNWVIYVLENKNMKQGQIIDSLKSCTNKIIIKYEKDVSNFSDVYIVSDDSIARYIRARIDNI